MRADTTPVVWDLSQVLPATEGPAFESVLKQLESKVKQMEAARPTLDAIKSSDQVVALVNLSSEIHDLSQRLGGYGSLEFSVDTTDAKAKAFMAKMDDLLTEAGNRIRFFDLWWKALPEDRAKALTPKDADIAYHLRHMRMFTPHTLTESEERIVAIKDITGATAIDRLREILTASLKYKDPKTGEMVTQSALVKHVHDPDAKIREAAYKELWRVYTDIENPMSFLYQTVVTDWNNEALKLRKYERAISSRNKGNDVPDEAVQTLLDVCRDNRALFQRYFAWKGKRIGIGKMSRYHIYAPLESKEMKIPYEQAKQRVLATFESFSPEVARQAKRVFDEHHVHAYPAPNKRGGAYCATIVSTMTPYVFLNHTDDASSLKTLSHEMGHAVHSMLAEKRHPLVAHSALPMAETASVFAEMLLHHELMKEADPAQRIAILSEKIGEIYATVERQAYFVRFEVEAHKRIMAGATAEELNELYLGQLREQFGDIDVPEEFKREWTYIPHIYASPFYCYAYSFGMLLSLALYGMYQEQGKAFVPKYLELLAAGGSDSPANIVAKLGVDIKDRKFWQKGFDVIAEMVAELEKLSAHT